MFCECKLKKAMKNVIHNRLTPLLCPHQTIHFNQVQKSDHDYHGYHGYTIHMVVTVVTFFSFLRWESNQASNHSNVRHSVYSVSVQVVGHPCQDRPLDFIRREKGPIEITEQRPLLNITFTQTIYIVIQYVLQGSGSDPMEGRVVRSFHWSEGKAKSFIKRTVHVTAGSQHVIVVVTALVTVWNLCFSSYYSD